MLAVHGTPVTLIFASWPPKDGLLASPRNTKKLGCSLGLMLILQLWLWSTSRVFALATMTRYIHVLRRRSTGVTFVPKIF